ncbi:MAG: hypothetical protein BWX71_02069 [Deltaproteobacteria bacterium ADurb.Bin072]|nr:MAG: hypothetical protein BWX71_02069 [Deltaproteobacteria bacterium ADurb.Bin072]
MTSWMPAPGKDSETRFTWLGATNMPRTLTASPTRPAMPARRSAVLPQAQGSSMMLDRSPVPNLNRKKMELRRVTTTSPSSPDFTQWPVAGSTISTMTSSQMCQPLLVEHS